MIQTVATQLTLGNKASYAIGDFGINIYWQGIGLFLFFFYTDVMQIPAWWAGFTILIASIWDAVTDVLVAGLADRTRSAKGSYRPYLLYGAPILGLGFVITFIVPPGLDTTGLIVYAIATHLILRTVYTLIAIPYSSLSARMTSDSDQRGILAGWRMQAAALGGLTTAFATPGIVAYFTALSGDDPRLGWFYAAVAMALMATVLIWTCYAGTSERPVPDHAKRDTRLRADFLVAARMLRRNAPLRKVFICIMMASLCLAMMSKTLMYWFKYAVGDAAAAGPALAIAPLVLLFCAPLWVMASVRWSKQRAWIIGCCIALAGYLVFYLAPMREPMFIYAALIVIATGTSSFAVMFWAMLPDTVEYDQWLSGERHEAKVFGFASFAQKAALGANAFLLGTLLDVIGFEANIGQSEATLNALKAIMSLVPAFGVVVTLVTLRGYPITSEVHRRIQANIEGTDTNLEVEIK